VCARSSKPTDKDDTKLRHVGEDRGKDHDHDRGKDHDHDHGRDHDHDHGGDHDHDHGGDHDHDHGRDHDHDHGRDHDHDHGRDHDHDHNGDHDGDDGEKGGPPGPTATPFLLIPSGARDTGARPIPVTQAVNNNSVQANITNPTVGTGWTDFEIQLSCIVADLGVMGCAAGLAEFYVGDQFSAWNPGHEGLTAAQVKANAQLIGYASFQVPPGGTATITCKNTWKPGSSSAARKGVLVQIYDFFTDRMTVPFDAINDRHVARNDQAISSTIVSQGTVTLKDLYLFDLDAGVQSVLGGARPGADILWVRVEEIGTGPGNINSAQWMTPQNSASIINLGAVYFSSLTAANLQTLAYATTPIVGTDGDVFAVRTTNGNYAKVLVVFYGSELVIQWVTYAPPP